MDNTSSKIINTEKLRSSFTIQTQHATFKDENATNRATPNATIDLKALASKVLHRNTQRNTSATTPEIQCNFRRNSTPLKVALNLSGCTINELQKLGGDDWLESKESPEAREAFAKSVATRKLREKGIKPDNYSQSSQCQQCGPIYLWKGAPTEVEACVWCFNRFTGVDIPRPELISCSQCDHFVPNDYTPNAGMGGCHKGLRGKFANQQHSCNCFSVMKYG